MRIGIAKYLGVFLLGLSCTDNFTEKGKSDQIVEINFENTYDTSSFQTKSIEAPEVVEIFANDLDYDKYERENSKQEYYNLVDFQGYYSEIVVPILDSLEISRSKIDSKDMRLIFKAENGDIYIVDSRKIQSKQGLILFNGKLEPPSGLSMPMNK